MKIHFQGSRKMSRDNCDGQEETIVNALREPLRRLPSMMEMDNELIMQEESRFIKCLMLKYKCFLLFTITSIMLSLIVTTAAFFLLQKQAVLDQILQHFDKQSLQSNSSAESRMFDNVDGVLI